MPLFKCENPDCGAIENTALGLYWGVEKSLCSACAPPCEDPDDQRVRPLGKWHGKFPKRNATEAGYYTDGTYLYSPDEVDPVTMEWTHNRRYKMTGLA